MYTTGEMIDLLKPGMRAVGRNPECNIWDGIEVTALDVNEDGWIAIWCKSPLPNEHGRSRSLPLCGQVMALKWEIKE